MITGVAVRYTYITLFRNAVGYQILNINTGFFRKHSVDTLHCDEQKDNQHYPVLHSNFPHTNFLDTDTLVCQKLS